MLEQELLVPLDTACCGVHCLHEVLLSQLMAKSTWQACPCCSRAWHTCAVGLLKALEAVERHMPKNFEQSSGWTLSLCDGFLMC